MTKVKQEPGGMADQLQPVISEMKLDEENQNLLFKIDALNSARVRAAETLEKATEKVNALISKVENDGTLTLRELQAIRADIINAGASLVINR